MDILTSLNQSFFDSIMINSLADTIYAFNRFIQSLKHA